jgi:hypothetical protein
MTFKQALKACKTAGTAHATGDALRAMYASLISQMHGGEAERYFAYLQKSAQEDREIEDKSRALLRSREAAWKVILQ